MRPNNEYLKTLGENTQRYIARLEAENLWLRGAMRSHIYFLYCNREYDYSRDLVECKTCHNCDLCKALAGGEEKPRRAAGRRPNGRKSIAGGEEKE
jgi:hypothetical protein